MCNFVALNGSWIHPNFVSDYVYGEAANVIGERVERAAAGKIEPGMVPVARQDAVLNAAPIQGEAHVGTAIIHRIKSPVVVNHRNGMSTSGYHPASTRLELPYPPGPYLSFKLRGHDDCLPV